MHHTLLFDGGYLMGTDRVGKKSKAIDIIGFNCKSPAGEWTIKRTASGKSLNIAMGALEHLPKF